jgi:hypothetical protein
MVILTRPNATTMNAAGPSSALTRSPVCGGPVSCHANSATPTITVAASSQNRIRSRFEVNPNGDVSIARIRNNAPTASSATWAGAPVTTSGDAGRATAYTVCTALPAPNMAAAAATSRQNRRPARVVVGSEATVRLTRVSTAWITVRADQQTTPRAAAGTSPSPKPSSTSTPTAPMASMPRSRCHGAAVTGTPAC